MKTRAICLLFSLSLLFPIGFHAADASTDEDEIFELSPFEVMEYEDEGYRAVDTLAGTRIRTNLKDVGNSISVVTEQFLTAAGTRIVNIEDATEAHFSSARGIIVRFAVGYYDDLEENRRKHLVSLLKTIEAKATDDESVIFNRGRLRIPEGDRKKNRGVPRSQLTSYAYFSLSFSLSDGLSAFKKVNALRDLIASLEIENEFTKLYFGDAVVLSSSPFASTAYGTPAQAFERFSTDTSDIGTSIPYLTDSLNRPLGENAPHSPVSLVKLADAVSVRFAIDTQASIEKERIDILTTALDRIRESTESIAGARFIPGSTLLRHGDREGEMTKPRGSFTSQAQFSIFFELGEDRDAVLLLQEIRQSVQETELPEAISKVHFGPAALVLENPQRFRPAILEAIFEDAKNLQALLGDGFQVLPQVREQRVSLRRHSETEVEVWIPYDYKILSLENLAEERDRAAREHELALAKIEATKPHCHIIGKRECVSE